MKTIFFALLIFATAAAAQTYPSKPVRWVVPFPTGGGTDLTSRTLAAKLTEAWNVQVVADNRPGSGGTIGMGIAAKTPANTPEEFGAFIRADIPKWSKVIKDAKIKVD